MISLNGFYVKNSSQKPLKFEGIPIDSNGCFAKTTPSYELKGAIKGAEGEFAITSGAGVFSFKGAVEGDTLKGKWLKNTETDYFEVKIMKIDSKPSEKPTTTTTKPMAHDKWVGYYVQFGEQHPMELNLTLGLDGKFTGSGSDEVGSFEMNGTLIGDDVDITKQYIGQHSVSYIGKYNGGVIRGKWDIHGCCSDEFEIKQA